MYTYLFLFLILMGGLYIILKPSKEKKGKEKQKNKDIEQSVEENLEQVENLNMVMFLLHDMAREYRKAEYNKASVDEFVGKIVVSKSWEERLSNLPKQSDE